MPAVLLPVLLLALPPLPLDALPTAVRERVATAYQSAVADPGSARASGSVAMLLQAYDQFEVARRRRVQRSARLDDVSESAGTVS